MEELLGFWTNFITARQQLVEHHFIRTFNNPVEDFAEFLVAIVVSGELAINVNQRDYDVKTIDKYIQVKSIAKAPDNPHTTKFLKLTVQKTLAKIRINVDNIAAYKPYSTNGGTIVYLKIPITDDPWINVIEEPDDIDQMAKESYTISEKR